MPLGSRLTHESVLEGRRARLYDLILGRPGITFLELARATMGHYGITAHHLYILERFQLVRSYRTHRCRRYYSFVGEPEQDKRDAFLREPHLRATYEHIQTAPGISQTALAHEFPGLTRQAVSHRVARLRQAGIVEETRQGRWTGYRVVDSTTPVRPAPANPIPALARKAP